MYYHKKKTGILQIVFGNENQVKRNFINNYDKTHKVKKNQNLNFQKLN